MLPGALNSKQAIEVNIAIMRIFTKLRSFMLLEKELNMRMNKLESDTTEVFKIVFEKLGALDKQLPTHKKCRTKIGLTNRDKKAPNKSRLFLLSILNEYLPTTPQSYT